MIHEFLYEFLDSFGKERDCEYCEFSERDVQNWGFRGNEAIMMKNTRLLSVQFGS